MELIIILIVQAAVGLILISWTAMPVRHKHNRRRKGLAQWQIELRKAIRLIVLSGKVS